MKVMGIVRLAPGQVGFYDDLTRIHLTIANPVREVIEGMNTRNLKRAVKYGRLLLVSGTLSAETSSKIVVEKEKPVVKETKEAKKVTENKASKDVEVKKEVKEEVKEEVKVEDKKSEVKVEEKKAETKTDDKKDDDQVEKESKKESKGTKKDTNEKKPTKEKK